MAQLPNAAECIVDALKVSSYLLAENHPVGRWKAAYFKQFGFQSSEPEKLGEALKTHALNSAIISVSVSRFGTKFVARGKLDAPDGRQPEIQSVWFVTHADRRPRLVTAYPARGIR